MAEKVQGAENRITAGVFGILLGGIGIHRFILGDISGGFLRIVISIFTCGAGGSLIGFIEGILYLTKSDEDFVQTYIEGDKKWF